MKIALVTETFPPEINGVAMTFGVIARELGRRGHAAGFDYAAARQFVRHGENALAVPLERSEALVDAAVLPATDNLCGPSSGAPRGSCSPGRP